MPRPVAIVVQFIFTVFYGLIALLTALFVVPVVLVRERFGRHAPLVAVIVALSSFALAGCTVQVNQARNQVRQSAETAGDLIDRGVEFARGAPPAPYDASGDEQKFKEAIELNDLNLTKTQLGLISGAAKIVSADPALVATIIEQELRWLDDGELERDIVSAIAGEDSSVGLGQVRVSTAEELEQEDRWDTLPTFESGDQERTERVRRLAADDWNVLYASAYVALLAERFPSDAPLDLAQRYLGASPSNPRVGDQAELFDIFSEIL